MSSERNSRKSCGRHRLEHLDVVDQDAFDRVDPREVVARAFGVVLEQPVADRLELEDQLLEPQLVRLMDDDEQELVVHGRIRTQPLEPDQLGDGEVLAVGEEALLGRLGEPAHPPNASLRFLGRLGHTSILGARRRLPRILDPMYRPPTTEGGDHASTERHHRRGVHDRVRSPSRRLHRARRPRRGRRTSRSAIRSPRATSRTATRTAATRSRSSSSNRRACRICDWSSSRVPASGRARSTAPSLAARTPRVRSSPRRSRCWGAGTSRSSRSRSARTT